MLKKILMAVVVLVAGLLIFASTRPDKYHVQRSTVIAAPPALIFAQLSDFRAWAAWSPWEKRDPQMRKTYGGPPSGVGSTYAWEGNKEVGKGKMTIMESEPPNHVRLQLEFIEPFTSVAATGFTLTPEGDNKTAVTWGMDGSNNFVSKMFSLVMNMDKMIGGDFESGLSALRSLSEAEAAKQAMATAQASAAAAAVAAQQAAVDAEAASAAAEPASATKTKPSRKP